MKADCGPVATIFFTANTLVAGAVSGVYAGISIVLRLRHDAEICVAVVCPNAVYVIDLPHRPLALNDEDRDRRQRVKSRCRGERNHHASLTEQMVRHIRDLRRQGFSLRQIATRMHITKSAVAYVSSGKTWGWLSDTPLGDAALEREGLRP